MHFLTLSGTANVDLEAALKADFEITEKLAARMIGRLTDRCRLVRRALELVK